MEVRYTEHLLNNVLTQPWEQGDGEYRGVEVDMGCKGGRLRLQNASGVVVDIDACHSERRKIVRSESVEVVGIALRHPVASVEFSTKADTDFGNTSSAEFVTVGSKFDSRDEVFLAVGTQHADGQLAACENDGLAEIFQHDRQSRGCVSHGVGAVQNDKAVVLLIAVGDDAHQFGPQLRLHITRVDRRVKLIAMQVVIKLPQLGHMATQMLEVEGFQSTSFWIAYHADSATSVYQQHTAFGKLTLSHLLNQHFFPVDDVNSLR